MLRDRRERLDGVALRLRHLLAVLVEHEPVDDDVFVRHAVGDERGDGVERVEPAARLIDALGDEVGRDVLLELLLVLERVVPLRERHRPAVEPHVEEVGDAAVRTAVRRRPRDVVHERPVQVEFFVVAQPRFLAQLGDGADHDVVVLVGVVDPDRDRRAPVAHPADGPVDVAFEPLPEPAFADALGLPVNRPVQLDEPVFDGRRADEPALDGILHERRALPPVVRVVVEVGVLAKEQPARREVADDRAVGVFEPQPADHVEPVGSNVPSERIGLSRPRPCFCPVLKSSAPKAGAVWTMPVPSSVVT